MPSLHFIAVLIGQNPRLSTVRGLATGETTEIIEVILAEEGTDSVVCCEMPKMKRPSIRNDRQEDDVTQPASTVEREGVVQITT